MSRTLSNTYHNSVLGQSTTRSSLSDTEHAEQNGNRDHVKTAPSHPHTYYNQSIQHGPAIDRICGATMGIQSQLTWQYVWLDNDTITRLMVFHCLLTCMSSEMGFEMRAFCVDLLTTLIGTLVNSSLVFWANLSSLWRARTTMYHRAIRVP